MSYLPTALKTVRYRNRGLRILLGMVAGKKGNYHQLTMPNYFILIDILCDFYIFCRQWFKCNTTNNVDQYCYSVKESADEKY